MKNLIFVHLPKAAGSTLAEILRRQYRDKRYFSMAPEDYEGSVKQVAQLSKSDGRKGWLLCGHQFFGMHRFFSGETRYVSIVRDPSDRLASMYYYIKRRPEHYLYEQLEQNNMSLADFVESGMARELDNIQVRLLCGEEADLPYGEISEEHLHKAMRNIEQFFEVVGIQEQFDESLLLMRHKLGWKKLPIYRSMNVTQARPKVQDVEIRRRILEINKFDAQLYAWVKQRFENDLAGMNDLADLLEVYREKNRRFAARPHPIAFAKNIVRKHVLTR